MCFYKARIFKYVASENAPLADGETNDAPLVLILQSCSPISIVLKHID